MIYLCECFVTFKQGHVLPIFCPFVIDVKTWLVEFTFLTLIIHVLTLFQPNQTMFGYM